MKSGSDERWGSQSTVAIGKVYCIGVCCTAVNKMIERRMTKRLRYRIKSFDKRYFQDLFMHDDGT